MTIIKKLIISVALLAAQSNFCMDVGSQPEVEKRWPEDNEDLIVIQSEKDIGLFTELYVAYKEWQHINMDGNLKCSSACYPDRSEDGSPQPDLILYGKIKWDMDYKPGKKSPYPTRLLLYPLATSYGIRDQRHYRESFGIHPDDIHFPMTVRLLKLQEIRALDVLFRKGHSNHLWHGYCLSLEDLTPRERRLYRNDMYKQLVPMLVLLAAAAKDSESSLHTLPEKPRRLIGRYLVDAHCRSELLPKLALRSFQEGRPNGSECNVQ